MAFTTPSRLFLSMLLAFICPELVHSLTYCQAGTFELKPPLGGKEVCEHCLTGTFMPHDDHRYKKCFTCTKIEDPLLDIVASPCNRTNDAVIQCIKGYYRRQPRKPREKARCEKCSECQHPYYEVQSCQTNTDTGCCLGENSDSYVNPDGVPLCRERDWMCRQGQYYNPASALCMPCPSNTFMDLDYHSMTKCWDCQNPLGPLHSVILQPCSSTHPLILGCEDGYFISHSKGYYSTDIGCSLCTSCSTSMYVGRECGRFSNTVCCKESNMKVVDGPDGPECLEQVAIAETQSTQKPSTNVDDAGQQLSFVNFTDSSKSCESCKQGSLGSNNTQTLKASDGEESESAEIFMGLIICSVLIAVMLVISLLCHLNSFKEKMQMLVFRRKPVPQSGRLNGVTPTGEQPNENNKLLNKSVEITVD